MTTADVVKFRSKAVDLPRIISDWCAPFLGDLKGKRVLDFGCGEGATALGLATGSHTPELVAGADINREHAECLDLARRSGIASALPPNLLFEEIKRGEVTRHEGFDLIYSWSVFEHIDQRLFSGVVQGIRDKLKPGGYLFVQIQPLYYSPEGGHLYALGYRNWEHLSRQIDHIYGAIYSTLEKTHADALWSAFITLNKITGPHLLDNIARHGFALAREYRTKVAQEPPEPLLLAYSKEALVTDQIVVLFRKV